LAVCLGDAGADRPGEFHTFPFRRRDRQL
jgi:hypothetical protein